MQKAIIFRWIWWYWFEPQKEKKHTQTHNLDTRKWKNGDLFPKIAISFSFYNMINI